MSPILVRCLLLAGGLGLMVGCNGRQSALGPDASEPATASVRQEAAAPPQSTSAELDELQADVARLAISSSEELLRVVTTNLDLDSSDEQILVVRGITQRISLLVADFDPVGGAYTETWRTELTSNAATALDVYTLDMVGDHKVEIVVAGSDAAGTRTLEIFRRHGDSPSLSFFPIARISSAGSVEITEVDRPEAYQTGSSAAASFPVLAEISDPSSSNSNDLIRITYNWDIGRDQYVRVKTERIAGVAVAELLLQELFRSTGDVVFETFLSGPWYREVPSRTIDQNRKEIEILLLDPVARKITFFSGEIQEIYDWARSHRPLRNRIGIWVSNESINSIQKYLTIDVSSLGEIRLAMKDQSAGDPFRATYLRLSDVDQTTLVTQASATVDVELAGLYRSDRHGTLSFTGSRFTWDQGDRVLSGGFAVVAVPRTVLALLAVNSYGIQQEQLAFIVDYAEHTSGSRLVRALALTPARLSVEGATTQGDTPLRFDQVEIVDESTTGVLSPPPPPGS